MSRHDPIVKNTPVQLTWSVEEDAVDFARRLAALPQLADTCIELRGELGAGKTSLARHLLRALGVTGPIKSPTYALLEPYETPTGLRVSHFDFYRFEDPREWEDAGFREVFAAPGLKLVEWPEQAAGLLPAPDLALHIAVLADERRSVRMQAHTATGRQLLQGLV